MYLRNFQNRLAFCQRLFQVIPQNTVVFFSDEWPFHLSDCVNKQNIRWWSATYPRELHEKPLHGIKATLWWAISYECVIGTYFFRADNGRGFHKTRHSLHWKKPTEVVHDMLQRRLISMNCSSTDRPLEISPCRVT